MTNNSQNINDVDETEALEDYNEKRGDLKSRLLSADHWLRFVYMIIFALLLGVASYIMTVVVIVQFVWSLFSGENNKKIRQFGWSLSQYIHQALLFLTYNSEEKPFPFDDWPEADD